MSGLGWVALIQNLSLFGTSLKVCCVVVGGGGWCSALAQTFGLVCNENARSYS